MRDGLYKDEYEARTGIGVGVGFATSVEEGSGAETP